MMKKIICAGMAVAMMAALAIPASAAGATNTTTVEFKYQTNKTIDGDTDGVYKITIPATFNLKEDTTELKDGTGFNGTEKIKVSGVIGKDDTITVAVISENEWNLMDGDKKIAAYNMTVKDASADGVINPHDGVFSGTQDVEIATFKAEAFNKESTVELEIDDTGSNSIYGAGTYTDTLTFSYMYNSEDGTGDNVYTDAEK